MTLKVLLTIVYLFYALSYILPAYVSTTLLYSNTNTEIIPGWKCAIVIFDLIFTNHLNWPAIALSLPNVFMILLIFIYKKIGLVFLILILIFNFISCSYWWFFSLAKGNISDLLPGYWLWFISIIAGNIIFILSKQNRN